MDINIRDTVKHQNAAWAQLEHEMLQLAKKYPTLNAQRDKDPKTGQPTGIWEITGPYQAVKAFKDLAVQFAELLGYKATREQRVQFVLDHINGDHRRYGGPDKPVQNEETIVTLTDGSKQGYRGRQRIG